MYKKNKSKIIITLGIFLSVIIPQITLASAVSLRSSSTTIEPNKTFNVSVYVNPSSVTSYTAQVVLNFPADLVSIDSFTYNSAWIPLSQSGLDLIDNTSGKMIKTAGYPSGFSQEVLLGTIKMKSKKSGSVTILTNKESYVLDIDSNNTLKTYGTFSITSTAPVAPVVVPKTTPTTTTTTTKTVEKKVETPVVKEEPAKSSEVTTTTENTNTEIPVEGKTNSKKIILFIGIILGAISAYLGFK